MKELKFPLLSANDIECRVAQVGESRNGNGWCSILLYKDARCDQRILDAAVGPFAWQREHVLINNHLFCVVSIWDDEKQMWIKKQDVGTESNTEAVKGEASDAFKRACFCWGIGRELYTAPQIFISLDEKEVDKSRGKAKVSNKVKFYVGHIEYDLERKEITELVIVDGDGKERFKYNIAYAQKAVEDARKILKESKDAEKEAEELMQKALAELDAVNSRKELNEVWLRYPQFQVKDSEFYNKAVAVGAKFRK